MDDAGGFDAQGRRELYAFGRKLQVDVLSPDQELIASFASVTEAYRYASLIYSPNYVPTLARRSDGELIRFDPHSAISGLKSWVAAA